MNIINNFDKENFVQKRLEFKESTSESYSIQFYETLTGTLFYHRLSFVFQKTISMLGISSSSDIAIVNHPSLPSPTLFQFFCAHSSLHNILKNEFARGFRDTIRVTGIFFRNFEKYLSFLGNVSKVFSIQKAIGLKLSKEEVFS